MIHRHPKEHQRLMQNENDRSAIRSDPQAHDIDSEGNVRPAADVAEEMSASWHHLASSRPVMASKSERAEALAEEGNVSVEVLHRRDRGSESETLSVFIGILTSMHPPNDGAVEHSGKSTGNRNIARSTWIRELELVGRPISETGEKLEYAYKFIGGNPHYENGAVVS